MADVRKIVNGGEPVEQSWNDTNGQVVELFGTKPTLMAVTLTYQGDDEFQTKLYERIVAGDSEIDPEDDEG